jgi:protein ImuB
MPRLASLYLPNLPIDRIRRSERIAARRKAPKALPLEGGGLGGGGVDAGLSLSEDSTPPHEQVRIAPRSEAISGGDGDLLIPPPQGEGSQGVKPGHWRPGARWAREAPATNAVPHAGAGALVTAQRDGNRNLLAAVCGEARALGLAVGTPLARARILVPNLDVRDADPEGDSAWLARLGLFAARRWTPRAAASGPDGLWLDLTGVAHLFGGEQRMCARILAFCRRLGFTARIAVAGTAGAAHALARFGGKPLLLCPAGGEADALAPIPLAALRLDPAALGAASRLGLDRVGELIAMPRAPLQRRFGAALLLRLDQALGRAPEPFEPIVPEEPPSVLLRFQEPIATAEAIAEATGEAVRRLVPLLSEAGLGVRHLLLACDRVDNVEQYVMISLSRATRYGDHLRKLLWAKIEKIEPGFGIERLRLTAVRVEPLAPQPVESELAGAKPAPDLALLIDRLAVRLGTRRLHRLGALESDVPERSIRRTGPLQMPAPWPRWPRPARLLVPPEPIEQVLSALPDGPPRRFRWRGKGYRVAAADGPERIYGEWWRHAAEREAVRDYFQVEDEAGARFWLYRKGDGEDSGTGDLSWHMHGLFA